MILLQTIVPAMLVFVIFIVGHFFISSKGSGIYLPDMDFEIETAVDS